MPIESALRIVNRTGGTVVDVDGRGIITGNGHMITSNKPISWPLLAASVDTYIWTAVEGIWNVTGVRSAVSVVGGSGATVDVKVCAGATAPASGTTQLSAAIDLTVTAPNIANPTMITTPTNIQPGDSVSLDFAGTLTGLVGAITVMLKRIA